MDRQNKEASAGMVPGSVPMVRIDGAKIRRLRESQGLTQLYLSAVVGVTTDTISRWENRHYQSIKLDNAEKLAGALSVSLEDILEQPSESRPEALTPQEEVAPEQQPQSDRRSLKWVVVAVAALALIVIALFMYALFPKQPLGAVTAQRILPRHAPPGQTFPVLLRVRTAGPATISLILKESLPQNCTSSRAIPATAMGDIQDNSLKWIGRTDPGESIFAYLCQVATDAAYGEMLSFRGGITLKQALGSQEVVSGDETVSVAPFHWADVNSDLVIDDEEILAVYDLYSEIKGLEIDRDKIDEIWAAGGYRWDGGKKTFPTPGQ